MTSLEQNRRARRMKPARGGAIRRRLGLCALVAGTVLVAAFGFLAVGGAVMASAAARPSPSPFTTITEQEQGGITVKNPIDWNHWLNVNDDIAAWVNIPGTGIDYPVVQASEADPGYYLDHDVYRGWNLFGCPYLDAGCKQGMDSPNTVIVGHNISFPPSMFHDLEHFVDPDFAREHLTAYVYTPTSVRRFKVVGVKTIAGWEPLKRVEFADEHDFATYCEELIESCDERYETMSTYDRIVTLCSCSYYLHPDDERTLVFLADDNA